MNATRNIETALNTLKLFKRVKTNNTSTPKVYNGHGLLATCEFSDLTGGLNNCYVSVAELPTEILIKLEEHDLSQHMFYNGKLLLYIGSYHYPTHVEGRLWKSAPLTWEERSYFR